MDSVNFINALDVSERCAILNDAVQNHLFQATFDEDAWKQWRERKCSLTEDQINEVMSLRGYSSEVVSMAITNKPTDEVVRFLSAATAQSEWFRDICRVVDTHDFVRQIQNEPTYALVYAPFLTDYIKSISSRIRNHPKISEDTLESFIVGMSTILQNICIRVVIMELQTFEDSEGTVNPEEKLKRFLAKFSDQENLEAFYAKFPALARRLDESKRQFVDFTLKLLEDIQISASACIFGEDERIFELGFGAGDTHCGGKTVVRITTDKENVFYYKPRSFQVESVYKEIIDLLNSVQGIDSLVVAPTVEFEDFSISREVSYQSCDSEEQVHKAYHRFGEILGISYLLNFTDLHMENLVISGEQPVIVDEETFLTNRLPISLESLPKASIAVMERITGFVTSTIILPSELYLDSTLRSVDLGAISGREQTIENVLVLKDVHNANVRFERDTAVMPGAKNLVLYKGVITEYREYFDDIYSGFNCAVEGISGLRNKVKSVLSSYEGAQSRVLIRPTSSYARLLEFTLHPNCMMDRREADKILENLYAMPGVSADIYKAEYRDMMNGDIPYFTTDIDSVDLITSDGSRISNVFPASAKQRAISQLETSDPNLIDAQRTLIRLKIQAENTDSRNDAILDSRTTEAKEPANSSSIMEEVVRIADGILNQAVRNKSDKSVSWLSLDEEHHFNPVPLQNDIYSGMSGIGLLFHFLGHETKNKKYQDFADDLLTTVERPTFTISHGLSAFVGPCSSAYFALKVSAQKPSSRAAKSFTHEIMTGIRKVVESGKWDDLSWLTGVSSFLPLLTEFYIRTGDDRWLATASNFADRLVANANSGQLDGLGISHGLLGPAVAIGRFGIMSRSSSHVDFSRDLLSKIFSLDDHELYAAKSFCRGTSGLVSAISDAVSRGILPAGFLEKSIEKTGFLDFELMRDDSLCHGNCSQLDAAVSAYNATNNVEYLNLSYKIAGAMIERRSMTGRYQVERFPGFPETSMFKSTPGVAYTLLRLLYPHLPSIPMLT